ncbi:uncharacterized protein J3D65DRAFT_11343 [Phyllosticta citribraziliensis]|uniref:Uncharacterized protein n=1 Tax=Phyllosticta citribraziliensis TaxID=989973 RepID=A0ABR1M8P6_9PEZI
MSAGTSPRFPHATLSPSPVHQESAPHSDPVTQPSSSTPHDRAAPGPSTDDSNDPHDYGHAAGDAETLDIDYIPPHSTQETGRDAHRIIDPDQIDPAAEAQTLLPPANFTPFFTLVEDASTGHTEHPSVHYVFADDDPELHTAIFARALGDTSAVTSARHTSRHRSGFARGNEEEDDESSDPAAAASPQPILPPSVPGQKDRYVVLDLSADARSITQAQSLSREWQVISTSISAAPTFTEEGDDAGGSGALMLRVEGLEMATRGSGGRGTGGSVEEEAVDEVRRGAGGDLVSGLETLLRRLEDGLDLVGKVVGSNGELDHEHGQSGEAGAVGGDEGATGT